MEEKITKEMMEAKDKAFAENNKIIEKQSSQIFWWKGLSILLGMVSIASVITCVLVLFLNNRKMNTLKEELGCLTNQVQELTQTKEEAVDLLKDIDRYIFEDYEMYSSSNVDMVSKMREEIEKLCSFEKEQEKNLGGIPVPGFSDDIFYTIEKPIIYFENAPDCKINITMGHPEKITCSYPKYNDGWQVTVEKDGTINLGNRSYYGLYWEGSGTICKEITEGFCVKGEDTAEFLEKYLKILGLSERESNEFIVYWLPKMEKNPYNIVYFATAEEQQTYMPLEVSPAPDTLIRVNMVWKASDRYVDIATEEITPVKRAGYTVVEWGGTELK